MLKCRKSLPRLVPVTTRLNDAVNGSTPQNISGYRLQVVSSFSHLLSITRQRLELGIVLGAPPLSVRHGLLARDLRLVHSDFSSACGF